MRGAFTILVLLLVLGFATSGLPTIPHHLNLNATAAQTCAGFYDEFSSPFLEPGWSWINEGHWSLTERPGYLRINTEQTEADPTYLIREAPDEVDTIWANLEVQPEVGLQQAGIAILQDSNNYVRLVHTYAFGQRAMFVRMHNDEVQVQSTGLDTDALELRIERQGNTYVGYYRTGSDLIEVGRFENVDLPNPRVGLVATAGESGASPVDFNDFCLELPTVSAPTPTATAAPEDLTLTGRVYDAAVGSDRGISGATVSVLTCVPRRFQTLSGPDGQYSLFVPGQYLSGCSSVELEVWAAGYEDLSQSVAVDELYAQPERDFALTPFPHRVYLPLLMRTTLPAPPPPPTSTPTPTAFDPTAFDLELERVADNLGQPVYVTHAGDSSGRLFVVEKAGTIRIVSDGGINPTPFLDITQLVGSSGSEQGLLSVAFHPDYASNGLFFIDYTDTHGDTVVARYHVGDDPNVADPNSARTILTLDQPFANHNGGLLLFGPDGYLWIGTGDGGSGGDPFGNAQNPQVLLGKLLRLDVDGGAPYAIPPDNPFVGNPAVRDEIWALGLRNPWRYSFDRATGDLYIADVGQNRYEEIDYQPAGSRGGENYGWNIMEGLHCYQPSSGCDESGLTLPVAEYSHELGCSVTGGYVYRGSAFPAMAGAYYFGDYCSGRIWALYRDGAGRWATTQLLDSDVSISSFGKDEAGELYLTGLSDGGLYRLVATVK